MGKYAIQSNPIAEMQGQRSRSLSNQRNQQLLDQSKAEHPLRMQQMQQANQMGKMNIDAGQQKQAIAKEVMFAARLAAIPGGEARSAELDRLYAAAAEVGDAETVKRVHAIKSLSPEDQDEMLGKAVEFGEQVGVLPPRPKEAAQTSFQRVEVKDEDGKIVLAAWNPKTNQYFTPQGRIMENPVPVEKKPLVSISNESETEEQKARGRTYGKILDDAISEANDGRNQLAILNEIEELMAQGLETSPISSMTLGIRRFAGDLGLNVDDKQIAQQEAFGTISARMALRLRNPDSGLGLTGSTSEKDLEFLKSAVPGLEKTKEGNKLIVKLYKQKQERRVQAGVLAERWADETGTMKGFNEYLTNWENNNRMLSEEEEKEILRVSIMGLSDAELRAKIAAQKGK